MIYGTVFHQMTSHPSSFHVPDSTITHAARAVYYPVEGGGLRLARIEQFSRPMFREDGWEVVTDVRAPRATVCDPRPTSAADNLRRAIRRAKQNAFDAIMCNQDMNLFATLTYSPDAVEDKSDYKECYKYLNTFLSNRVQRRGLKYVCAPELTKKGDVHFHMICNAHGVGTLELARSPYTGKVLKRHGQKCLYNLIEWKRGFSSAEYITDLECDGSAYDRVAKYIFKYIGKDLNSKVGGRYLLMGGALQRPAYAYADDVSEFSTDAPVRYEKNVKIVGDLSYSAQYFI